MSTGIRKSSDPRQVLGYLLKHASAQFAAVTDAALETHGIDGKELGVLRVLTRLELTSQIALAEMLGIDRTTMVAVLDALEHKGLVARRPDPADRRRNVAALTPHGEDVYRAAEADYLAVEKRFLSVLDAEEGAGFRRALRALVAVPDSSGAPAD
jgi:DNA-binding MarR family transcriptional regulator